MNGASDTSGTSGTSTATLSSTPTTSGKRATAGGRPARILLDALAAERIKLLSTRSFWWCSALTILFVVAPVGALGAVAAADGRATVEGTEFVGLGLLVLLVMAATTVTAEYRHGTIRTTFLAVPRRWMALLAKIGLVAVACGALGLLTGFAARGAAWLAQPGADLALTTAGQWRAVAGPAAVYALAAVAAIAVAVLLRNTAGTVALLLGWYLVVEPILAVLPHVGDALRTWLPFTAAARFLDASGGDAGRPLFAERPLWGPWGSLGYFAAVAVALLALAIWRAHRRDA